MKILIDSSPLRGGDAIRGIGTYTRELTKALKTKGSDVLKEDLNKFDIVHLTRFNPFSVSVPFSKPHGTKFVLTIYDLIPLIYPKHYPPGIKGKINWRINKSRIKKNIDAIITISETSKKDICRFTGVNPDKVHVTYLAARSIFKELEIGNWKLEITKRFNLPDRFVLYVGDINYNKNIPNLISACRIAKTPLVIVGSQAKEVERLDLNHPELEHLKGVDWSGVIRPGFIEDRDLAKIYRLAEVYVQPSFYEGFGLPLLEAIASDTPVAVSKNQCHVEVLGPDFSYFDPNDPKDIVRAILNPNRNKKLPRIYSWDLTAEETRKIYAEI